MAMIRIPGLLLVIFTFWTKLSALPTSSGRGSHFALDIDSCTCTPLTTICEVTISSSVLQENHCPEKSHFCCTTKKAHISKPISETSGRSNNDVNSSSIPSNPRIKIVVPTTIAPQTAVTLESERPKPRCRCKARTKCAEKYTDYSFGFHCSHDKVRCCDPDDGFNTTEITPTSVKTSGLVINVSAPAADEETDKDNYNNDCRCLPELRCNIPADQISKRKDTSCPADLIQCCGHLILDAEKKSDEELLTDTDDDDDDNGESIKKISKGFAQHQSTPQLSGALQEGHSAHHQPVQIPLMKIPANSEAGPIMMTTTTTTMPPPKLPTQYYYPTQVPQYQHRYLYAPAAPRVQTPSYYITGESPGSHRYSDTFLVNHNGRGFKVAPQRSTSTGSILGSIASLLG